MTVIAVGIVSAPVLAREDGRFADASSEMREWFRAQKSPKTGEYCCDEADGAPAEETIRNGHYWARWPTVGEWQRVRDDVIIHDPNRRGGPVVWWHYDGSGIHVRCYVPGAGV